MNARLDPAVSLAPLFAALLASLTAPGCNRGYDGCGIIYGTDPHVVKLPATDLAPYLMDGMMSHDECELACSNFVESAGATSTGGTGTSGGTEGTGGTSGANTTGYDEYIGEFEGCSTKEIDAATIELTCNYRVVLGVCGRRPTGAVCSRRAAVADPELRWLLAAAELEAASVPAFEELAAELARHGAPEELRAGAWRAADDERRHAARASALVRRRGHEPGAPEVGPAPAGDLEALARHNAVEGCVRETWGALLAAFQARNATAEDVRAAQVEIAGDERAHAELAWQIDAWARTRLSAAAQARVDAARRAAARALAREAGTLGVGLAALGLPNATQARALLRGLQSALW